MWSMPGAYLTVCAKVKVGVFRTNITGYKEREGRGTEGEGRGKKGSGM